MLRRRYSSDFWPLRLCSPAWRLPDVGADFALSSPSVFSFSLRPLDQETGLSGANMVVNLARRLQRPWGADQPCGDCPPQIRNLDLHLGVHKTASTHFQTVLDHTLSETAAGSWGRNRDGEGHPAYLSPPQIHGGQTGLEEYLQDRAGRDEALRRFHRSIGPASEVIISDENILGLMGDNFRGQDAFAGPYLAGIPRLSALINLIGAMRVRVFLCIRHPAEYFASCYRYRLQTEGFVTWDEFAAGRHLRELRWLPLVRAIRDLPEVSQVILWRYEDYPTVLPKVLGEMLGDLCPDRIADLDPVNVGLSLRGVQRRYKRAGLPRTFRGDRFTPFGPEANGRATRRYARELRRLSGLERVTVLRP